MPRAAHTYRGFRRNKCKELHQIWSMKHYYEFNNRSKVMRKPVAVAPMIPPKAAPEQLKRRA